MTKEYKNLPEVRAVLAAVRKRQRQEKRALKAD